MSGDANAFDHLVVVVDEGADVVRLHAATHHGGAVGEGDIALEVLPVRRARLGEREHDGTGHGGDKRGSSRQANKMAAPLRRFYNAARLFRGVNCSHPAGFPEERRRCNLTISG